MSCPAPPTVPGRRRWRRLAAGLPDWNQPVSSSHPTDVRTAEPPRRGVDPHSQPAARPPSSRVPPPRGRKRVSRVRRWGIRFLVLSLFLGWIAGTSASLWLAREDLVAAQAALGDGRNALTEADLPGAVDAFAHARGSAESGLRHLRMPHVRIAAALPVAGDPLEVIDAIAEGVSEIGGAAHALASAAEEMPGGIDALRPDDGALPVRAIEQLAPHLADVAHALGASVRRVEQVATTDYLPGMIVRERDRFLSEASPLADGAMAASALSEHLPSYLGGEGPRRYLYVASNPAEPRGTGGYLGSYAIVEINEGAFDIGDWTPTRDLETRPTRALDAPNRSYARRYEAFGGAGYWQNINMTPDFPTAAAAMTNLWEEVYGDTVHGVISVDPFAFEALLAVSGPVTIEGRTIDAENVVRYVMNESYVELGEGSERQEIIGEVAEAALENYLHTPDMRALTQALQPLSDAATGGHLRLYSTDPDIQQAFRVAGLDGGFPQVRGDAFGVAVNDGSASKLNYYAQRRIEYEVDLLRHGRASGRLTWSIRNDAPSDGLIPYIIGPNHPGLEAGEMRSLVSMYCGPACVVTDRPVEDDDPIGASREQDFLFADTWIRVPSGEERSMTYTWTSDTAWEPDGDTLVYRLYYDDQVTVLPTSLRFLVRVPDGFEAIDLPEGAHVDEQAVVWERDGMRGDVELVVRFRPTG
jgi:hypothetical protein